VINSDDAHCYPACESCRVAGVCHRGPIVPPPPSPSASWAPNKLPLARFSCGCLGLPWPLVKVFGEHVEEVICDRHGIVTLAKPVKAKKQRKPREEVPGQEEIIPF
jgi:hypothetical protein